MSSLDDLRLDEELSISSQEVHLIEELDDDIESKKKSVRGLSRNQKVRLAGDIYKSGGLGDLKKTRAFFNFAEKDIAVYGENGSKLRKDFANCIQYYKKEPDTYLENLNIWKADQKCKRKMEAQKKEFTIPPFDDIRKLQ